MTFRFSNGGWSKAFRTEDSCNGNALERKSLLFMGKARNQGTTSHSCEGPAGRWLDD